MFRLQPKTVLLSLRRVLTTPAERMSKANQVVWFGFSLLTGLAFSILKASQAFAGEHVVQDDLRQFVFWMGRFSDSGLFPGDLIADYYQSITPLGYSTLFWLADAVGIEPFTLAKILPLILGLAVSAYCFVVCMRILPLPFAAFLATLTLSQCLSIRHDLVSATPRAFFYPLFLAFIYYLLRRSLLPFLIAAAMHGLFYPQGALLSAVILPLTLFRYKSRRLRLSRDRLEYRFCAAGIAVVLLVLLLHAWKSGGWGPVIEASQAREMIEYSPEGRLPFFENNNWDYWVTGQLSGAMPGTLPPVAWAGLLLPLLLLWSPKTPLITKITDSVTILPQIALGSVFMFFISHMLLAKLYFPSRYTQHSFRILLSIAGGLSIALLIHLILEVPEQLHTALKKTRELWALGVIFLLVYATLSGVPLDKISKGRNKIAKEEALYQFFSGQPDDILIATLSRVADNIPTFSKRSVLVAREYAIPIHIGYYSQIQRRAVDLTVAHYSPDLRQLCSFIRQYGVDFFVVERAAFSNEYVVKNSLIQLSPDAAKKALESIEQGTPSALSRVLDSCAILETEGLVVVKADCILSLPDE